MHITTEKPPAPANLPKMILCSCKGTETACKSYTCAKAGLYFTELYLNCNGRAC